MNEQQSTLTSKELLPWPFCGSAVSFHASKLEQDFCEGCHYIACSGPCGGFFDFSPVADPGNSSETIEALRERIIPIWNKRAAPETPVHLTQSTLDSLIAEADKYMLPVDVKMGAATFRKGVKVGTMLRGLKTHAERQTAEAWNPQPNCRFDEHAETCDWIGCPNNSPGSPTHCPLPWPRAELKANDQLYRLRPLCTCQGTAHESASSSGYTPNPTCPVHQQA